MPLTACQNFHFDWLATYGLNGLFFFIASWEELSNTTNHGVKWVRADHAGQELYFAGVSMPVGMEDCTKLPQITEALLRKGNMESDIARFGNWVLPLMPDVGVNFKASWGKAKKQDSWRLPKPGIKLFPGLLGRRYESCLLPVIKDQVRKFA